jgi:hypothetical protein
MTIFKDEITDVKALRVLGATAYIGNSANVSAYDATVGAVQVGSITNFSIMDFATTAFSSTETTAATIAAAVSFLYKALHNAGILHLNSDEA